MSANEFEAIRLERLMALAEFQGRVRGALRYSNQADALEEIRGALGHLEEREARVREQTTQLLAAGRRGQ